MSYTTITLALSRNAVQVVGANGQRRFDEFCQYPAGWDGGQGRPLSPGSLSAMELFLRQMPELAAYRPSLFLSYQGHLVLGWEDTQGGAIEIEFSPNEAEYFLESIADEGVTSLSQIAGVIAKVRGLCADVAPTLSA